MAPDSNNGLDIFIYTTCYDSIWLSIVFKYMFYSALLFICILYIQNNKSMNCFI